MLAFVPEVIVVGNGDRPSAALFSSVNHADAIVIGADGGANALVDLDITPDYIVGDLDSVAPVALQAVAANRHIRVDADNTSTDLVKALDFALTLNARSGAVLGATGGRVDHTLWNLSLLKRYCARLQLTILDEWCETSLIDGEIEFTAPVGQKLSLCPLTAASGITTSGLKFPLEVESLAAGERDGISNEVTESPVKITVAEGDLLLCIQRDTGG